MKRKFSDEHIIEIIKEYDAGVNPIWLVEWGLLIQRWTLKINAVSGVVSRSIRA
ncbi:MAG: hypothetical protein HOI86_12010 [Tateyamaria sp.]|jgi:hypothetical protein|nr:hypothetical protein [Tateyamaria sp.]